MATIYDLQNKAVTITGNNTIGYGTDAKAIKGFVVNIEEAGDIDTYALGHQGISNEGTYLVDAATKTALGITEGEYVASVQWHVTKEDVSISSTTAKQPVAGDFVTVDGTGGVSKVATAGAFSNAICDSVNTTAKTATITVL